MYNGKNTVNPSDESGTKNPLTVGKYESEEQFLHRQSELMDPNTPLNQIKKGIAIIQKSKENALSAMKALMASRLGDSYYF